MKRGGIRRKRLFGRTILFTSVVFFIGFGLLLLTLRSVDDPNSSSFIDDDDDDAVSDEDNARWINSSSVVEAKVDGGRLCATVEEMGSEFDGGFVDQSLRVRDVIRRHFHLNGAAAVRELAPEQFCRHGYVLGKTAEAGFGNEMYKILTSGALSIILNRSLIIGQTRHILVLSQSFFSAFLRTVLQVSEQGKYPFGDYIAYSNDTFTLTEVKHLWRQKGCVKKYGRRLVMRLDDFEKPAKSNVLCSNWKKWEEAIIWFQGTTDAVASQFFLKNVHPEMRAAAVELFGEQGSSTPRANVFGELMMSLISPTKDVKDAVDWVLRETGDPDISLHMRMLMSKYVITHFSISVCTGPEGAIETTSVFLVGEDCLSTSLVTISQLSDFVMQTLSTHSSL
ncbi:hypothetical protein DY000_02025384, partial [Brassica cretica]